MARPVYLSVEHFEVVFGMLRDNKEYTRHINGDFSASEPKRANTQPYKFEDYE